MSCLLSKSLVYCNDYNVGGVCELYFANKEYVTDYFFDISDSNLNTITSLTTYALIDWYHFTVINQTAIASEKQSKNSAGKLYNKQFEFTVSKQNSTKRDSIFELLNADSLVCVYKDYNSNWFIMGEDFGVRATFYEATTDKIGGINQYKIALTNSEKNQIRSISSTYVTANILTALGGSSECYFFVDNDTFDASLFYSTVLYTVESCNLTN